MKKVSFGEAVEFSFSASVYMKTYYQQKLSNSPFKKEDWWFEAIDKSTIRFTIRIHILSANELRCIADLFS